MSVANILNLILNLSIPWGKFLEPSRRFLVNKVIISRKKAGLLAGLILEISLLRRAQILSFYKV